MYNGFTGIIRIKGEIIMISIALKRPTIKTKALTATAAVILALVLPQLFHAAGVFLHLGPALGESFLPMHIPVLLAGLLAGWEAGLAAGLLSPLVSFAISGMPGAAMLPFMAVELGTYGLSSGLIRDAKMPVFAKVVIAQISGRALRILAFVIALYAAGKTVEPAYFTKFIVTGLPGIILQWVLVSFIVYRMRKSGRDE
jgi:uncharacterized membrane protein